MAKQASAPHLTHRANLKDTRYGWLRLTPAYSVHFVSDILDRFSPAETVVLDPFGGTGTTALVCGEKGFSCDTLDINPFLVWLARVKTTNYSQATLAEFRDHAARIGHILASRQKADAYWVPALHQIEKWWPEDVLRSLARAMREIHELQGVISHEAVNLLKIAFCRMMIEESHASFNHQSMSFKKSNQLVLLDLEAAAKVVTTWNTATEAIFHSAHAVMRKSPHVFEGDARALSQTLPANHYSLVLTSPPYPNRMSYIRELRPYMYWLGYLTNGRDAGEMDWRAIGGTWGIATSNLATWKPEVAIQHTFAGFHNLVANISAKSNLLATYILKYFHDMQIHAHDLYHVLRRGGQMYYVVGNSKFYDQLLPVEAIFAHIFQEVGFVDVKITQIRKRSSKRELYEFIVAGIKK